MRRPSFEVLVPKERGSAFTVRRGQILRVIAIDGAQTCDFNAFVQPSCRERFSAGRTRTLAGIHPTSPASLWSNPPHDRRLFTIIEDTVGENDLLFPRCSRMRYEEVGMFNHRNCQDNLSEAIAPYGLTSEDVHDAFNIFMNTWVDGAGGIHIGNPRAKEGDYLELECHVDCLVAVSACPDGDKFGRPNRPVKIEVC